jgi:hypothetical protein
LLRRFHRPLARLRHKPAVLERGAEIDLDAADLAAFKCEEFGVAKAPAICRQAAIGDEGLVANDEDMLDVVVRDPAGVLPAALEISCLVEIIVKGAGEAELVGQRVADLVPVSLAR